MTFSRYVFPCKVRESELSAGPSRGGPLCSRENRSKYAANHATYLKEFRRCVRRSGMCKPSNRISWKALITNLDSFLQFWSVPRRVHCRLRVCQLPCAKFWTVGYVQWNHLRWQKHLSWPSINVLRMRRNIRVRGVAWSVCSCLQISRKCIHSYLSWI